MSDVDYAVEKLWQAVHKLVSGPGRIKERLEEAAANVAMAAGARSAMSSDLRAEYDSTWSLLIAIAPKGNEGAVRATISQMSEEEAGGIASRILNVANMATKAGEK